MTDDLHERLERLADRIDPRGVGAFVRLDEHRRRRQRNRRSAALAVAAIVTVGAFATVIAAFDEDDARTVVADPDTSRRTQGRLTVWPENAVRGDGIQQAQAAVDAGDATAAWRLDPEKVAQRFGLMVLGWTNVQSAPIAETLPVADDAGPTTVFMLRPRCDVDEEGILEECGASDGVLTFVEQPGRTGPTGVWSVRGVISDDMAPTPLLDDDGTTITDPAVLDLTAGTTLEFALEVPDDRRAHLGIIATDGCHELVEFATEQRGPSAMLEIPDPGVRDGCARTASGYAFAYAQDATMVPVGDPLLESAPLAYPWITLVPVRVDLGPNASASETPEPRLSATVYCDRETTSVTAGPDVIARPDGVHILVNNAGADDVRVSVTASSETFVVSPGTHEVVAAAPPGLSRIACTWPDTGARGAVDLRVVDPMAAWIDPSLDCKEVTSAVFDASLPPEADDESRMERFTRGILEAEATRDIVPLAYPNNGRERIYGSVTPDGRIVGTVTFFSNDGRWYPDSFETCQDIADL